MTMTPTDTDPALRPGAAEEPVDYPGKKIGMWFFLFTELLFFGGMFLLYSIYRYRFPADFHDGAKDENLVLGSINTGVLLTSSLLMALSISAVRGGRSRLSRILQGGTISLGVVFLVIKGIEWGTKIARGIYPNGPTLLRLSNGEIIFFGLYFTMTGIHALHVMIGVVVIAFMIRYTRRGSSTAGASRGSRTPGCTGISSTSSGSTSFRCSIPAFRIKEDCVPGLKTHLWFNATDLGTYEVFCSEYCGVGHSHMRSSVIVMPQAGFDSWYQTKEEAGPAAEGAKVVRSKGCLGCHLTDGTRQVGPTFKALVGRQEKVMTAGREHTVTVDSAYIREYIPNPNQDIIEGYPPIMPKIMLTDGEMSAVIAYLETLK